MKSPDYADRHAAGETPRPTDETRAPPGNGKPPPGHGRRVPPPSIGPRVIGWREYLDLDLPPIEWALKWDDIDAGFIRDAGIIAIAGTPGSFKTTEAIVIGAGLATQGMRVGLVELEGNENDTRADIARAIGDHDVPNEHFLSARYEGLFSLCEEHYRDDLCEHFKDRVDVLVLDSLPKMVAGVDENAPEFAGAVELAIRLQHDIGARLLLLICHTVKAEWRAGESPCLADIRGHGSLAGLLDAAFVLRPCGDARELSQAGVAHFEIWPVKQRGAPLGPVVDMRLERDGKRLLRSYAVLDVSARKGKTGRPATKSEPELDAEILSYVRDAGEPVSKRQVQTHVGGGKDRASASLARLVGAKQLRITGAGEYEVRLP